MLTMPAWNTLIDPKEVSGWEARDKFLSRYFLNGLTDSQKKRLGQ